MRNDIRIFLIDTCGWIISISVIVFFFTLWLFSYNNVESSLKEAWSITFSALSALTAIGAAIIAAYLFNDWRIQHNKATEKDLILDLISIFSNMISDSFEMVISFEDYVENSNNGNSNDVNIKSIFHKLYLLDLKLHSFSIKYKIYCEFSKKPLENDVNKMVKSIRSDILYIDLEKDESSKIKIIRHRLKHNLIEFNQHFVDNEIKCLTSKLNAYSLL